MEHNRSKYTSEMEINSIAGRVFEKLAFYFPVCMASDEFHFFPQIRLPDHDWTRWDNFSTDAISDISRYLKKRVCDLQNLDKENLTIDDQIDIRILKQIITTICEQLSEVKLHFFQPSFYLTILGIGLAEACDAGQTALNARLKTLPGFIDHSRHNLAKIPGIFRDMGCEMIRQIIPWLGSLNVDGALLSPAVASLERFDDYLKHISISDKFLLSRELYEHIAFYHMGCNMDTDEISRQIDQEITESRLILETLSKKISSKKTWTEIIRRLPQPWLGSGGVKQLYHFTISQLADHCLENELVTPGMKTQCPVVVEEVPGYLLPVRSNAAYSMPPGYPPKGGTFFIMADDKMSVPSDYRLLTAHETFPGHHLLDTHRWSLKRSMRRYIEFPLYYEGWACFSEELLFDTGFFYSQTDKLLLAKRRYWRAVRGQIDLDIHTRKRNLKEAAQLLVDYGMDQKKAVAMVRRYVLKPGYQLSYTIGRRNFIDLYECFKKKEKDHIPSKFARQVLTQGEIGFNHLSQFLNVI